MSETGYEISLISSHPVPCPARHQQLFWIRIRGIPPFYLEDERREETGKCIGGAIGTHVRSLRGRGSGLLGSFLRIRVGVNIVEPLKRRINFRPAGESIGCQYNLYEHLPHFCLFCGLLDHTGNACPMKVDGIIFEPVFSDLLNAEKKEEWLRSKFASEEEEGALDLEDGGLDYIRKKNLAG